MLLEKTDEELRRFGERLFAFVEDLVGNPPRLIKSDDQYRAEVDERPFVYFRFVGERARVNPKHSVILTAPWDDRLAAAEVTRGNNWYGDTSADTAVQPKKPGDEARAERFIRDAMDARRNR